MNDKLYGIKLIRPELCGTITNSRLIDEWSPLKRNLYLVWYYFERDILPPLSIAIIITSLKIAVSI